MKRHLFVITLTLLLPIVVYCQVNQKPVSNNSIDYQGKKLSSEELQKLFTLELKKLDEAITLSGKISLVDSFPFKEITSTKEIKIDSLLTKDYYKIRNEILALNENQFLTYYNSLKDNEKHSILTSGFLTTEYAVLKENIKFKKLIIDEFERFINQSDGKLKSAWKLDKLNFLVLTQSEGVEKDIIAYLDNLKIGESNYRSAKFVFALSKLNEREALNYYSSLLSKQITLFENNETTDFVSLISIEEKSLLAKFLFSKNFEIRNEFINLSICTFKKGIYPYSKISYWVSLLWNSNKLNYSEKLSLIECFKDSKDKLLIDYSIKMKSNLLGIDYLDSINLLTDSISILYLVPISHNTLTIEQKNKLLTFIKKNEEVFKKYSKNDYYFGLNYINKNLNLKSLATLDYYQTELSKLGYNLNVDAEIMRYDIVTNYVIGGGFIDNLYSKNYLNEKFFSSSSIADIYFDTESGELPNNYPELIKDYFAVQLEKYYNIKINAAQTVIYTSNKKEVVSYEVYIKSINTNKIYKINIDNTGDWYALKSVIEVLNMILKDSEKEERFIKVKTGDQMSRYLLMKPASFLILDEKFNLNVNDEE
jgi:hypothetical protein